MGWIQEDGSRTTERLGENFVLCSPYGNIIVTCYIPTIEQVFGRDHKNWPMPRTQSQLFAFYGQNVSSTNGADWQRHRKITASAFNEKSMHEVWKESITRTKEIRLRSESARSLARIRSTFDVVAMHVLAKVGFGQGWDLESIPPGHQLSLMKSLGFILQNIMLTLLFNSLKAPDAILPGKLRQLKASVAEFRLYMEESVFHHMRSAKASLNQRSSLLGEMVKANESEKQQLQKQVGRPSYLTDSELYGNIFVFSLAGYETTASTMTFALSYLAQHPEIQDWVIEEVDKYYNPQSASANYAVVYNNLTRTLSVMYETLRLASPAAMLVRTATIPTDLSIISPGGPKTIQIDAGTTVGAQFYGAHLSPRWGPNTKSFNPKRFVSLSAAGEESISVPEGVLYTPWMFGPRVCPGKKFSQVEFVAAVAQVLSEYHIEVLTLDGESPESAKARLAHVLDEKYFNISTHLRRPEDAGVRFVHRTKNLGFL